MDYKPAIGLEIHAELKTRTKMFCDSLNDPDEKQPNKNICPICMGHPGTLPVINLKAVEHVLKVGLALGATIPKHSKFDRKNYFYPDLPKGYQISQYDEPLCVAGELEFIRGKEKKRIRIRRIHVEEDTGRLLHPEGKNYSLVDYNRAGVPLMELVTEPDISSGKEAREFAEELQLLFRYLGASDADMEKGQMRVEANVSVRRQQPENSKQQLGTKVEVKNLNSFRSVEEAINYEIKRQSELLGDKKEIVQETRGWDEITRVTVSQRWKEEAQDYRYFPEPDLPPLAIGVEPPPGGVFVDLETITREMPELPWGKRLRFSKEYGLAPDEVDLLVYEPEYADFFEKTVSEFEAGERGHDLKEKPKDLIQLVFNYLTSDLKGLLSERGVSLEECKIKAEHLAHLVLFIHQDKISSRVAKDVLLKMVETGRDPERIIREEGLFQVSDMAALENTIRKVIEQEPQAIADYKKGKVASLQFLVGKVMAETKGRANPKLAQELLAKILKE